MDLEAPPYLLPPRAVELFAVFTRFEYALKDWHYCRPGPSGDAQPDWDKLAKDLKQDFFLAAGEKNLAPVILTNPPKKQMAAGDAQSGYFPEWKVMAPPTDTRGLLEAVRRVRNNLFHGGKSGTPDKDREVVLIGESLAILRFILERDADLRMVYEGRY